MSRGPNCGEQVQPAGSEQRELGGRAAEGQPGQPVTSRAGQHAQQGGVLEGVERAGGKLRLGECRSEHGQWPAAAAGEPLAGGQRGQAKKRAYVAR